MVTARVKKDAEKLFARKEMRKVLTKKRFELLKTVKDKRPASVYELAKMLHCKINCEIGFTKI